MKADMVAGETLKADGYQIDTGEDFDNAVVNGVALNLRTGEGWINLAQ